MNRCFYHLCLFIASLSSLSGCIPAQSFKFHQETNHSIYEAIKSHTPLKLVSAHRGDRRTGEENSLLSIKTAIENQADLVEIDVRHTKDRTLYLFHDKRLSQKNCYGPERFFGRSIEELTEKEINQITVPGNKGKLTRLYEALQLVKNTPQLLTLDMKKQSTRMLTDVMEEVRQTKTFRNVIIQCSSLECLSFIKTSFPEVLVMIRIKKATDTNISTPYKPDIIQGDLLWLNQKIVRELHKRRIRTLVKTLQDGKGLEDTEEFWKVAFDRGINIILTDNFTGLVKYKNKNP